MFDERRQRTTGIDKSYPLQPISSNTRKSPLAASSVKAAASNATTTSLRRSSNGGISTTLLRKPNNLHSADSSVSVSSSVV